MNTTPVAFFDFDGTLTTGDTLMPFLKYVVGKPAYYTKLALLSPVLGAYFTQLLRNDVAKQIVLKRYLSGYYLSELEDAGTQFCEDILPNKLRPEGMERLEWHKAQRHDCVLVSASLDVYLKEWATRNGFIAALTSSLRQDEYGRVTGYLEAANCFGAEKCSRIQSWIDTRKPDVTYSYGDSKGDLQMLASTSEGWRYNARSNRFIKL